MNRCLSNTLNNELVFFFFRMKWPTGCFSGKKNCLIICQNLKCVRDGGDRIIHSFKNIYYILPASGKTRPHPQWRVWLCDLAVIYELKTSFFWSVVNDSSHVTVADTVEMFFVKQRGMLKLIFWSTCYHLNIRRSSFAVEPFLC